MKAVFVGASTLAVMTTRLLLRHGHEVVIIDRNKDRIDSLSQELDCGFLHGDGSKPAILRETNPDKTATLFCLTGNDQTNILASLVGRSLGFARVVTKIDDPEFEHICIELGLEDTIIPSRTIGRYLTDMVEGQDPLALSGMIKFDARAFSFVARNEDAGNVDDLDLPPETRLVCIYRDEEFIVPHEGLKLKAGDEVVLIAHTKQLAKLEERWSAQADNHSH